jgi:hypothetical protein
MAHRFPPLAPPEPYGAVHRPQMRPQARPVPAVPAAEVWLALAGFLTLCLALWGG